MCEKYLIAQKPKAEGPDLRVKYECTCVIPLLCLQHPEKIDIDDSLLGDVTVTRGCRTQVLASRVVTTSGYIAQMNL